MSLFTRIRGVFFKTLIGIGVFYLFVTLIAVPLVVPWVARSQAKKILKTPVTLRSVTVNPFLLRVTVSGLAILDKDKQVMAGFDKFSVDLSFLKLFRKEYRIESVVLEGLAVNVVLSPGGAVNLLDLVPQPAEKAGETVKQPETPPVFPQNVTTEVQTAFEPVPAAVTPKTALPLVVIDEISLRKGKISFIDRSVTPEFSTALSAIDVRITGFSTKADSQSHVTCRMSLDDTGVIEIETQLSPFVQPLRFETAFSLSNYGLKVLTPYVGKFTGRAVGNGKLDVKMNYLVGDNSLTASHKVLVQKFDFGEKVESPDALNLPFGLAIALLEDPQGRITITLPVSGDMSDPQFKYLHLVGQVVRNFFVKLVTKPFSFLASAMGLDAGTGTDEMGSLLFAPGKGELAAEEKEKISAFVRGLKERPKLSFAINGTYAPELDWEAIKTESFEKDYSALRQESNLSDKWIYHTLYARRFGFRSLWKLTRSYRSADGGYDQEAINAEIRKRIIEDAPPDRSALESLALSRASAVYDAMIEQGFGEERMKIGESREVQASFGKVPLEFTFTVFDSGPTVADTEEPAPEADMAGVSGTSEGEAVLP